jgi:general secretion pathway protein D
VFAPSTQRSPATPCVPLRRPASPRTFVGLLLLPILALAASAAPPDDAKVLERQRQQAVAQDQERDQEFRLLMEQGRQFLQKNDPVQAHRVLARAADLCPDDAACRSLLAEARASLASSRPEEILERVKAQVQGRDASFRRQLDQSLFEAEQALKAGRFDQVRQHAQRVLQGAGYVDAPAPVAAELRARAERLLAAADKESREADAAKQQADTAAKRQTAAHEGAGSLRAVRERGWKHLDKGEADRALACAEEMLRVAPGNEQGLFLKSEALKAKNQVVDNKALETERHEAEKTHMMRDLETELTVPKDIVENKVVLPEKATGRKPPEVADQPMERWEQQLRAKLRERITFEFKDSSITDACRYLSELSQSPILVDPAVARESKRITLPKMSDLTLDHALRWLCRFWDATYVVRDHAILITRRGGRLNEPILRDYDVTGLLMPVRSIRTALDSSNQLEDNSRAPHNLSTPSDKVDVKEQAVSKEAIGEGWASFIRSSVAPESWDTGSRTAQEAEKPRYTIQYRNGRIVVVHTPDVHEQIANLLESYRKERNLQVHIHARILSIDLDYLQDISLNFPHNDNGTPADTTDDSFGFIDPREDPPLPGRHRQRWELTADLSHDTGVGEIAGSFTNANQGGLSVGYHYLNHTEVVALLNAVIKHRKGTLLIAPRITCFNTQRANFQALTNYNYVRSVSSDQEPEIGNVPDGIIFDVQPFISADHRYITLVLQPQLRTLRNFASFAYISGDVGGAAGGTNRAVQLPTSELTSMATTVTIPDGGSLLVGGLSNVTERDGLATLPFVYAIPGIRYFLRATRDAERRTSLIIMVTAEIVKDIFEQE